MQIRRPLALLSLLMTLIAPPVVAEDFVPPKRFVLTQDADRPGGDLSTLLDTTIEACERACMADQRCTDFTFNSRNGSCFTKQSPGEDAFYQGAFSGRLVANDPQVVAAATERRAELKFLSDGEILDARNQAVDLANRHTSGSWTDAEHLATAAEREAQGDLGSAVNFAGAAVNASDKPEVWLEYARLLIDAAQRSDSPSDLRYRAIQASTNAYLRASNKAVRHNALVLMARAMEAYGRGADAVKALRLAQQLQPRDDTAALLDDYAGKYGFRILETDIQSDTARPRVCVNVSEDLVESGLDYTPFVQLAETGLTVQPGGWRQLCIEGVQHGKRYQFTFREGLPSADGQELAKSVQISAYVRDRQPGVRFSGRAYVLPKTDAAALPVVTVNTETLDLALFRVSDRSILRAVQNGYLSWPIAEYQESGFTDDIGERLWTGTATVAQEVNKDVTTRLPMGEALNGLQAGIYAVKASVPGVDPYAVPAAWQWFVVSDLGVTSLSGTDGLHVIVRSLSSADAKEGVTVELLSRTNNVLGTAVTDDKGYARFDAGLTRGTGGGAPAMLVAKQGEGDLAFLSLTDPEFDLSDRGVEGREAAGPIDVFLTTDRGAYRAGETVYATALTRDPQANAIEGLPLTAIFKRPDGVEYARQQANDAGKGGHVFAQSIAGSAPRGVWRMEVFADLQANPLTSQTFLVEDFLPERIDFTMELPDTPLRLGDIAELDVEAKYLFGAPGGDLAIEGDVLLRAAKELPGLPGYVFGRHDQPFDARMDSFSGGTTDAAGKANVGAVLPEVDDPGRPLEARITLRIAEGSGRPVERRIEKVLSPSRAMIGVKSLFDGEVPENGEARFALQGIGPDLAPEPMKVAWELTRVQTDYQWYSYSGNWNWEPVTTRTRIANGEADLGTSPVEVGAPVQWGQYELAVSRIDGTPAETSTSFYAGWYAPADATATPDTLELSLDKPAYRPGETAKLRVVPRAAGTALVMVMADRLVSMQAVEVSEGENLIDLPVTDDWGAGVYVTASVLRPMDVAAGRNPARALGLAHAAIDPGEAKLAVAVQAPAESAPRAPLDVAIKVDGVAMGDTAYVTVAAVDVGILNLTGFKSPDPAGYYFGQRKLGMGIRDVYGRLIDGLNGAEGQVRSGGDAGAQARLQAPPPTEELVAYFTGPVEVGADGLAKVSFDLPAFNGTVKVMAVAWSGKSVGQADAEILVRDPVVVTASLPRFMAPGDDSRLLLEVVHATGPAGRMKLGAQSEGGIALGEMPGEIDLGEKQKQVLTVPVHADQAGLGKITVTLTTPDGKDLVKTLMLPVQSGEPEIARISRFDLAKGQEFTFDANVFDGFMPGTSKATMAVGPIARLNVPGLLEALDRYPYGCTEQMTSRALPLVYFDQVAQVMQLKGAENISLRIEQSVTEILQNQNSEGAFGLWQAPESSGNDLWLDAYVTDFLSRARAQGYKVPDLAFRNALDNLRNQVNYYSDFDNGGQDLAYALLVLAREGAAAVGDLRYYADVKGDAFSTALSQAQIGAALASYGDPTRADAMFRKAMDRLDAAKPETAQIYRADYGTDLRDSAAVLTLAVEAGSQAVNRDALISRISTNGAMSTQESVWTLLASNALIDGAGADITMNGEAVTGPLVRVMSDGTAPTVVRNNGSDTFLTVTAYGVPSEPLTAAGNGYAITRSYYTLEGEAASLDDLKVGTRLVTVLEVTPFDRGEARLIVNDPLPAGFEIDNPNLISGGAVSSLDWLGLETDAEHSEFRQDRFITAVDRHDNAPFRLAYIVRAVSPGTFTHPAASVEDMYRPSFRAQSGTGRISIAQ
ncbi:alpha-2-macroglobulin family protein [Gemmobacter serpentinus]|uniref:alpha-2-macroglobulin family protein n=1 Tax=Gemmobacter serpentinus TaxID=2652247 RepID=UPI00124E3E95|nr:alpha-2-macroglobulin family protein [Gemmobacter serpentinus]